MNVQTGLDVLQSTEFAGLKGKRVGILCHQASIDRRFQHIMDVFLDAQARNLITVKAVFGPQHGLWGHTQDNMIEWQSFTDPRTGLPVYSLYGETRKPLPEMLDGLDAMVIDLQDVGARYYTFIWTMALTMEACAEQGIEVWVLDRPNPIGRALEGPLQEENFLSFVGLKPILPRHGMTIGEIARWLQSEYYPQLNLQVVSMKNWAPDMYFEATGLPWAMPSPNMPTVETAVVYPGMCLLEGTNLSEGRGTTRPFEIFGAPWMDGWHIAEKLNEYELPGVYFRPIEFQPTFQKYGGEVCQGCFIHVTDRKAFKPFLTGVAVIREAIQCYPDKFRWKEPPYEYEYHKLPIDILLGSKTLRQRIEHLESLESLEASWQPDEKTFSEIRENYILYP